MRIAICTAIGLLACGCGSDEGPTGPTRSTAEHLVIVRVLNAESGAPLTNLSVAVLDGPQAGTSVTSPSDQVPLQLRSGDVTLRITAQGFHPIDRAVRVNAPMVVEVQSDRIVFSLSGVVRDAVSGRGIPGANIEIGRGSDAGRGTQSENDGSYRLEQLLPGTKDILVKADGYIERTIQIPLTESQSVDIPLSELFRLFGIVTDGRGSPLPGVRVRTEVATPVTDASGRFELRASENTVAVSKLEPPSGYEPRTGGRLQAGSNNILSVKRILGLTILRGRTEMCVGGGRRNVHPVVAYDTGEVIDLAGTRNYDVRPVSSNLQVLNVGVGGSGDGAYYEPLAPGTATVTATYWGVASPPVSVRVVRC